MLKPHKKTYAKDRVDSIYTSINLCKCVKWNEIPLLYCHKCVYQTVLSYIELIKKILESI